MLSDTRSDAADASRDASDTTDRRFVSVPLSAPGPTVVHLLAIMIACGIVIPVLAAIAYLAPVVLRFYGAAAALALVCGGLLSFSSDFLFGRELRLARDGLAFRIGRFAPRFWSWSEVEGAVVEEGTVVLHLEGGETVRLGISHVDMSLHPRAFAQAPTLDAWIRDAVTRAESPEPRPPAQAAAGYRGHKDAALRAAGDRALPVRVRVAALSQVVINEDTVQQLKRVVDESAAPLLIAEIGRRLGSSKRSGRSR